MQALDIVKFMDFLKKFKGVKLNKALLQDIDSKTKAFVEKQIGLKTLTGIRKAEKALKSYYKQRLDEASKGKLTFAEFQAINGKKENKIKREMATKRRLYTKYTKKLDDKAEKMFFKILKERLFTTSRLLRTSGEADDMYRYILGFVTSQVVGLTTKDYTKLKKGIEKRAKSDRHFEMVLDSQKALLRSNMDAAFDEVTDAIAFRWETQVDERVVGNPKGLYPKVYDEYAHGNHWDREGKLYFYPNSSAVRNGFINKKSASYRSVDSLKDGRPSEAYNCRCFSHSISTLSEVFDYDETLLTKKGKEFLKSHI